MSLCLIVDDDKNSRLLTSEVAKLLGLSVCEFENGLEALEFCKKNMPDIIILDWMMPQMSGITFLSEVQKIQSAIKPKIVMCSAKFGNNYVREGLEAGADEYLMKPARPRDLESIFYSIQKRDSSTAH